MLTSAQINGVVQVLDVIEQLLVNQFEAALCTLSLCIERCPDAAWDMPVGNLAFCQVAFHTLFYTDFYLGPDEESFRLQAFHRENGDFFRDYEEFGERAPVLRYDKPSINTYVAHCRSKGRRHD
jgi:hypothetical protein